MKCAQEGSSNQLMVHEGDAARILEKQVLSTCDEDVIFQTVRAGGIIRYLLLYYSQSRSCETVIKTSKCKAMFLHKIVKNFCDEKVNIEPGAPIRLVQVYSEKCTSPIKCGAFSWSSSCYHFEHYVKSQASGEYRRIWLC